MNSKTIRVLLIEGNPDDARFFYKMLTQDRSSGLKVECATRLQEGLACIAQRKIDVILTDLSLPDNHGLSTFEKIHKAAPNIPIVIISSYADETFALEAVSRGAQEYLVKELIDIRVVIRVIRYAIERKRIQSALHESEKKYKNLFDNILSGIVHVDTKGKIMFANDRMYQIFEADSEDVIGKPFVHLVHPSDRKRMQELFDQSVQRGQPTGRSYVTRCVSKSGREIIVDLISTAITENGNLIGFQTMLNDVTQHQLAEEAFRDSEQKLQILLKNLPDFIMNVDRNGTILYINRTQPQYQDQQIVGRSAYEFWTKPDGEKLRKALKRIFTTGETVGFESTDIDGARYITKNIPIKADGKIKTAMLIATDITKTSRVQEIMQRSSEFRKLLMTISTRFINLDSNELDEGINYALRLIGEFLRVDRAYAFKFNSTKTHFSNTHEWCVRGIASQISKLQELSVESFSWFYKELITNNIVNVPSVYDLPPAAQIEKEEFQRESIQSLICLPMVVAGDIIGFVGFDSVREMKVWSEEVVALLKITGEIFANAIERKSNDEILQHLNRCFLDFGPDPIENINRIVSLCGSILEADGALYNRIEGTMLNAVGRWNVPSDHAVMSEAEGHICSDVIGRNKDQPVLIRNLAETKYAKTDLCVTKYNIKTYFGQPVKLGNAFGGILCMVYSRDFIPRKSDKQLIGFASSAIAIEEERARSQEAWKESKTFLSDIFDSIQDGMSVLNTDMTIRHVNDVMKKWYKDNLPLEGKKCYECYHNTISPCDPCPTIRCIKSGVTEQDIVPGLPGSDIEWIELFSHPMKDPKTGRVKGIVEFVRNITERKKAEEALRYSEIKHKALIGNIPGMVYTATPDWSAEIISGSQEICGYSNDEINNKKDKWLGIIHPDDRKRIFNEGSSLTKRQRAIVQVYRIIDKKGNIRWIEDHKLSRFSAKREFLGIDGIVFDITERRNAEKVMNIQSAAMAGSMDGIAILNEKDEYVYLNEAHAHIYGYNSPSELIGKTWQILYDKNELKRFENEIMPAFFKEGKWRGEAIGKRHNGSLFPQDISLTKLADKGLICVVRDITDRKKAEEVIRESEERYRSLVDTAPDTIFTISIPQGIFVSLNLAFEKQSGWARKEWIGKSFKDIVHPDDMLEATKKMTKIVNHKTIETMELRSFTKTGEILHNEVIASPLIKDNKVVALIGVARNVTERKYSEQELEQHRKHLEDLVEQRTRELRQSERLAATGRLSASIAHEINNPLQGITTHLEIIRDHLPNKFPKLKNYEYVHTNIEKIRTIVSKLLDTFKTSEEEKTEIDINNLIKCVTSLIEHQMKLFNITVKIELDPNIPTLEGWSQHLHQVILNLLLNAQDSIKQKGSITIKTFARRGVVCIEVTDTGEGIKEENLENIFEPFFTTKLLSGTGLGLFVCQGIIEEHKGKIEVESKYGKGATFRVVLPTGIEDKYGRRHTDY